MGSDPNRVIRAVMSAARGPDDQKQLAAYMRAQGLREDDPLYPDDRTISRWMSARGVPADALVVAQLKILEDGGSIDELLGQQSPLRARVSDLEDRLRVLEELVDQMLPLGTQAPTEQSESSMRLER